MIFYTETMERQFSILAILFFSTHKEINGGIFLKNVFLVTIFIVKLTLKLLHVF